MLRKNWVLGTQEYNFINVDGSVEKKYTFLWIIILGVIGLLILIAVFGVLVLLKRNKEKDDELIGQISE